MDGARVAAVVEQPVFRNTVQEARLTAGGLAAPVCPATATPATEDVLRLVAEDVDARRRGVGQHPRREFWPSSTSSASNRSGTRASALSIR